MTSDDVEAMVNVHQAAFPGFFLSLLGPRFLWLFYRSFLEDFDGIGLVASNDDGSVLGSVVGPFRPEEYFKRLLKRRWWNFFWASLPATVKKPGITCRLFRALWYRGQSPARSQIPQALMSSVSVAPEFQGSGIGQALIRSWLTEVKRRGGQAAYLTTDAENNSAVNFFYQRLGWRLESSFTGAKKRRMNRYFYDLRELF